MRHVTNLPWFSYQCEPCTIAMHLISYMPDESISVDLVGKQSLFAFICLYKFHFYQIERFYLKDRPFIWGLRLLSHGKFSNSPWTIFIQLAKSMIL